MELTASRDQPEALERDAGTVRQCRLGQARERLSLDLTMDELKEEEERLRMLGSA